MNQKKKQNQKHKNKIKNKEKKKKRNSPVIINAIRQGLKNIFSQVNKNLVSLFESLPHVFTNSREKTQVSRTWANSLNRRSELINFQKLMSECRITQLNVLMNFLQDEKS